MRLVLHVLAACLLAVSVTVSANFENTVVQETNLKSPVDDGDKPIAEITQKYVKKDEKSEPLTSKSTDTPKIEKPEESQNNKKPSDIQKPEDLTRKDQTEVKLKKITPQEPGTLIEKYEKPQEMEVKKENSAKGDAERIEKQEEQRVTYNGVKVLRVVIQNKEQKKMLRQLENKGEISRWSGNGTAVDILVKQQRVFDLIKDKKLIYDVVIDDLQKAIEEENPPIPEDEWSELEGRKVEPYSQRMGDGILRPFYYWIINDVERNSEKADYVGHFHGTRKTKRKKKKRRGHRMTWQMYHRMADIHGYMDYLTATYPDTCSQETIGYSVEGRPLKILKISSNEQNAKAMWVDSGIHAREWITPATSTYIISQMVENGDGAHGVDWYFLPLVNPDGYEHSHTSDRLWRKNRANAYKGPCAGTDLNRNFGYRWGGQGSSQQPCRETYAGTGPFSEPETNSINKFVLSKSKDLKAYVSLHSYGQYILYPWGYDRKVPPDYSDLHRVGRSMAQAMKNSGGQTYRVGSAAATLYPASGGSDDWAKGTAKIKYTYTIELRDTGRHGFVLPAQYIQPTAKEAYAALKTLAHEVKQL